MIAEVSTALRSLYAPLLPSGAHLRFGAPNGDPGHALCFFLASVVEDARAVPADWEDVRDEQGRVTARQPPVRRFDMLYLVTAWAKDNEREDALLDVVLNATVPAVRLDPKLLGGTLRGTDAPVLVRLAPEATQVWASLDLPARTVLGLTVSAPLIRPLDTDIAPPADQITLGVDRATPPGAGRPTGPATRRPGQWRRTRIDEHDEQHPPVPRQSAPTVKESHATRGKTG